MRLILVFLISLFSYLATAEAQESPLAAKALDKRLYLQVKNSLSLYSFADSMSGTQTPPYHLAIPRESILAIEVENFTAALRDSTQTYICGFRIVDIPSEEFHNSSTSGLDNFCLPKKDLAQTLPLEGNTPRVLFAYQQFNKGHLNALENLSADLRQARYEREMGWVEKSNAITKMISPIKTCELKCLEVSSEFGKRSHPVFGIKRAHKGIDFKAAIGTEVVSVLPGTVLAVNTERSLLTKKMKGYGLYLIVVHPEQDLETRYAHLSAFKVKAGADVEQGDLLALSGNSGTGTGPHLHFEVHVQKKNRSQAVDPRLFLREVP